MSGLSELIPLLWKLAEKKKCAVNVSIINNEFVVNILGRFKKKCIKAPDSKLIISAINTYLQT